MIIQEFSNEFDVLYNNIMSNQAPGLDEYEKSVFLTKAQSEIIKNYFNPKGNKYQEGFDGSQKRQVDFSKLMKTYASSGTAPAPTSFFGNVTGAYKVAWPDDVFVVVNEVVDVTKKDDNRKYRLQVIPIKYDEYLRVSSKPYKQPLKNQAWRIINGENDINLIVGHLNSVSPDGYHMRYIKHPKPIILENLDGSNLSINGETTVMSCELDPEIHPEILQRAVELARAAYAGDLKSNVELGQRNE
nr:MAG TPA: hypothetical protein [Crassvirales sp.]